MLWKCPCGEINLGVAHQCRNCGKDFSEEFIIERNNNVNIPSADNLTENIEKQEYFGFFDLFKIFLLLLLFSFSLDFMISMIIKFSYSKAELTQIFGSDSFWKILHTVEKIPSPKTFVGILHEFTSSIFTVYLFWHFSCRKYNRKVKDVLGFNKISRKQVKDSLLIGFLVSIISISFGFLSDNVPCALDDWISSNMFFIYFGISAIFVAPIIEEIIFRGVLYDFVLRITGIRFTIIFVGFLFGMIHLPQLYPNFAPVIGDIFVGFLLTYLRYKNDSIYSSMLAHFAMNFTTISMSVILGIIASFF